MFTYTFAQKRELLLLVVKKITVDYDAGEMPKKHLKELARDTLNVNIELNLNPEKLSNILKVFSLKKEEIEVVNAKAEIREGTYRTAPTSALPLASSAGCFLDEMILI